MTDDRHEMGYASWKALAQGNEFTPYHVIEGPENVLAICGNREQCFFCHVDAETYATWQADFPTSTLCDSPEDACISVSGFSVAPPPPVEADGKPNFVPVPFTNGLFMLISARGDKLEGGEVKRGQGDRLYYKFLGTESDSYQEAVITLHELIELHDGHVDYDPADWGFEDEWGIHVRIPATPVTLVANPGTPNGNCNLAAAQAFTAWDSETAYQGGEFVTDGATGINFVATAPSTGQAPFGGAAWQHIANVIVPAAGDGYYHVVLASAIAVPYEGAGYWDYAPWDDAFTASSTPGYADWILFDFAPGDVYIARGMPCSSQRGFWEMDAYKVEPVYARWQVVFSVTRDDHTNRGVAEIGGHYTCFRETTT